jgi:hypothetical protein
MMAHYLSELPPAWGTSFREMELMQYYLSASLNNCRPRALA